MRYLTFNLHDCVQRCIIQGALIYDEGQQPPVPLLIVCQGQVHHPPPFTPVIKSTNHPHCTCTPDKQIWGNIWLEAGLNIKGAKTRKKQARNVRGYCDLQRCEALSRVRPEKERGRKMLHFFSWRLADCPKRQFLHSWFQHQLKDFPLLFQ